MDMETMELYKRMPVNAYRDAGLYRHNEFCSNCGQNEHEDMIRGIAMHKRRTRNYEKHCPSCHCPPERRRFSSPGRPRPSENVEAIINRCERVFADPINSAIKKSQSSPLSQKLCWYEYQTDPHSRCRRRPSHRQRRLEQDKYLFRTKGDAANSELTNEDIAAYSKYARTVPVKSSLKKHSHSRQTERSPDERECSEAESEVSVKYTPRIVRTRKSRMPDPGSRPRHVGIGDGEYVAEARNESDVESQEMRKLVLGLENLERLKQGDGEATVTMISEDDKRLEKQRPDVARTMKSRKFGEAASRCVTSKSSTLIGQSVNRPTKELVLNGPAHLTKLDLQATRTRILESIDRILDTKDDTKNDAPVQQEQTEQETIEKITHELQESGWQLLINDLTNYKDSADTSRRIVRLECLNHIRQQLDKLYALESTLGNCSSKLHLSSYDMPCNEERQQSQHQLEQKTVES
ncbi:uncharacterized protein LOC105836612 isoform X2 [Monomorium pharaonis]|uniref:uncharacterized protein LOC105836612 isoform X2 n=1 Tax=Monomorium pharaonis TaxID=307658 RepID=UPI00102E183B|nr:uncharacterized protein LOC105836612 isoform X2 [Monomorium pharaonis]